MSGYDTDVAGWADHQAALPRRPARGLAIDGVRARPDIARALADSRGPRPIEAEMPGARKVVAVALAEYGEPARVDLDDMCLTDDEVVGDWFPDG